MDTKTFFRYEITFVFELRDYFNQRTIENEIFTYIVKNDTLLSIWIYKGEIRNGRSYH